MIQAALNGMVTLMMTKLIVNDLPHAGSVISRKNLLALKEWQISISRTLVGSDIIPGIYMTNQVPRKIRELIAIPPSDLEAIYVSPAEVPETRRPGPFLPTMPRLKEPGKLWIIDAVGAMGSTDIGTRRAFLVPELIQEKLPTLYEGEIMRIYPYEEKL